MASSSKYLVLAGLLVGVGFSSIAQTTAPVLDATPVPMAVASGPRGSMAHGEHRGMRGPMDPAKMEAMVAKHLVEVKAKLKITADQEGAWTTFTTAMKPPAGMVKHKRPDRAEMDKLTTPERIDRMRALRAQRMAEMNAAMDKRDEAIKSFYAVLNADQKQVFDAEHSRMMDRLGAHHPRGNSPMGGEKPTAK